MLLYRGSSGFLICTILCCKKKKKKGTNKQKSPPASKQLCMFLHRNLFVYCFSPKFSPSLQMLQTVLFWNSLIEKWVYHKVDYLSLILSIFIQNSSAEAHFFLSSVSFKGVLIFWGKANEIVLISWKMSFSDKVSLLNLSKRNSNCLFLEVLIIGRIFQSASLS